MQRLEPAGARRRAPALFMVLLAPLLFGCGRRGTDLPAAGHDSRTELRREQDCANSQWKAANLGLWHNVCPHDPF